jgi:hypothetical protein
MNAYRDSCYSDRHFKKALTGVISDAMTFFIIIASSLRRAAIPYSQCVDLDRASAVNKNSSDNRRRIDNIGYLWNNALA